MSTRLPAVHKVRQTDSLDEVDPQVDSGNAEQDGNNPEVDFEDAMLMQGFMSVAFHANRHQEANPQYQPTQCAIGVPGETHVEAQAFQFDPAAAEFQPNAYVLPGMGSGH